MSYYDNKDAKVNLSRVLRENGWKIYGYKADESDSMTDYWSPASWDGIATKNDYILVVDNKGLYNSGKYGYPVFTHSNPGKCNWHIEKDGNIIDKGMGIFQCHQSNSHYKESDGYKKEQEIINKFITRFEAAISSKEELKAIEVEEVIKVTKPVIVDSIQPDQFILNNTIIKLNGHFTGGHNKGALLMFVEICKITGNYMFVRLGKKYQPLKRYGAANNSLTLKADKLAKWIEEGSILIAEIQEVKETTVKTVYKKVEKENTNTTIQEDKNNNIAESPITSENVTINYNDEKNGIELSFPSKPDQSIIDALKANGFRWSRFNKVWFNKQSEKSISFAESLLPKQEEETTQQTEVSPVIESTTIQQSEQTEEEKAQYTADQIIDISADIIHSFNSTMKNMSDDQFALYIQQLKEQTKQYNITSLVQQIIRENGCQSILDALFFNTRYNMPQDTTQDVIQPSNTSTPTPTKNNVISFSERLKAKQEQREYIEQRDILINKVLPNLSKDELYQIYSEKDKNKAAELLEHFYMLTLIRENLKE